ncbi:hypothetical protein ABEB36_012024 [Hypothenemus hampei]|uniref:Uncharacterized protein n=1 Tax=Hypothenemus hampei TaxID=57062 RepID=A0ABD1E9T2_HYPHA
MASEAQRLIGISLTKIAQSRSHRGGVSLHKNLLVATVLQKARYIFMEEAYNMVHYHQAQPSAPQHNMVAQQQSGNDLAVGLTVEEAGFKAEVIQQQETSASSSQQGCTKCNKENRPPACELTYLDLDKASGNRATNLKRRRAVAEWETEEAVQSILPKKSRVQEEDTICRNSDSSDSVFLDDATLLSDVVSKEVETVESSNKNLIEEQPLPNGNAMEIDRITSLVSIFSFSMNSGGSNSSSNDSGKLNRSVSTPDLCAAQATKDTQDGLQQRPFLAMTV